MTEEQKMQLHVLVNVLVRESEALGSIQSSIHWNAAYFKQQKAHIAVREFIESL